MPAEIPSKDELFEITSRIYRHYFADTFQGTVDWSTRLTKTAGRCEVSFYNCRPAQARIILSLPYYRQHGLAELERIIKHELAHYRLFWTTGTKHRHNSRAFRELLALMDAPRYAKVSPECEPKAKPRYTYVCPTCGHIYYRKRRINGSCSLCDRNYNPKHHLILKK